MWQLEDCNGNDHRICQTEEQYYSLGLDPCYVFPHMPADTVELLDVYATAYLHCFTIKSVVGLMCHMVVKSICRIIDVQLSICGMCVGGREQ